MPDPTNAPSALPAQSAAMPTVLADDPKLQTRRWRRLTLRVAFCLALVGMALLSVYFYRWYRAEQALQVAIAEADRLDPGWRLAELEAKRAAIPDAQNSALQVHATGRSASLALNKATNWQDLRKSTEPLHALSPKTRLTPMQAAAIRAALVPLDVPLAQGRKLADLLNGRFPFDASPPLDYRLPNVDNAGIVRNILYPDVLLNVQDGNCDKAWASCLALLNVGRSFGDEPMEVAQAVRAARIEEAVRLMERILGQGQVHEGDLAEGQNRLHEELIHPALLISLRGVRGYYHSLMTNVETGQIRMTDLKMRLARSWKTPDIKDELRGFLSSHEAKPAHEWLLRYTTQAVEIAKLPDHEAYPALKRHESSIADAPELARQMAPIWRNFPSLQDRRALFACAYAALATERYRLKHDRWPSELADLVAERFLDAVPADPYDGKPLRYRKTLDGVVIYSIGASGDCKGDALDGDPPNANDDRLEFRLWNSNQR